MIVLMSKERKMAKWLDEVSQCVLDAVSENVEAQQEVLLAAIGEQIRLHLGLLAVKPSPCVKGIPLGRGGM